MEANTAPDSASLSSRTMSSRQPSFDSNYVSKPASGAFGDGSHVIMPSRESYSDPDRAPEPSVTYYSNTLGNEMVKIEVGTGNMKAHFTIHRQILCAKIPHFNSILNSLSPEARDRGVILPSTHPDGFRLLVCWVYTGSIEQQSNGKYRTTELFYLFALASNYDIVALQDEAMECIVRELRKSLSSERFTLDHVQYAYENTPWKSKLRLFCARSLVESMAKTHYWLWSDLEISELLIKLPDLVLDIVPMTRGRVDPKTPDATQAPISDYYHEDTDNYESDESHPHFDLSIEERGGRIRKRKAPDDYDRGSRYRRPYVHGEP
ncbi:hypothetical protein OCU04_006626 [Sclerotinia nivalis]|uniref:BTB domain-containing protein n=1 Tax=Sclerotinia nivalis TaxID=352851 RepID=A0A9X0AK46_9HELO|nr:hypothetical protein OCU04_006626 [Sclerotinia nivalis]